MKLTLKKIPLSTIIGLACLIGSPSAHAANQTWTNLSGGDWNTGANWTSAVPAAGDNATLNAAAPSYTVDYTSPMVAASFAALNISNASAGQTTALNVSSTGFNLTAQSTIGDRGLLNVNTGGVMALSSGNHLNAYGGNIVVNGGALTVTGANIHVGFSSAITSSVTVNSGSLTVGADINLFGLGSSNNALNINGGIVTMGTLKAGDRSIVSMTGGVMNVLSSGINIGNGGGLGGAQTMTVSGGTINNANLLRVGYTAGRTATVNMSAGTWNQGTTTGNVSIGNTNTQDAAVFNLSGGTFHNFGLLTIADTAYTGGAGTFEGTINQTGGVWQQDKAVTVGAVGSGKLAVSSGTFTAHNGSNTAIITVGSGSSIGNLTLSGSGNLIADGLVASNGANSVVNFNGGTLNTKATTISTGSMFTVGNGSTGASLILNGGSHSFANGVTLSNNATLGGTGTITLGSLVVSSGATLSPGNSPGTLTVGATTLEGGGNYNWQVLNATGAAGTGFDTISLTTGNALTLNNTSGNTFNINLWSLSSIGPDVNGNTSNFNNAVDQSWTLISTDQTIAGFSADKFTINTGAVNGTGGFSNTLAPFGSFSVALGDGNTDLMLVYTAVPEPSTCALAVIGLTLVTTFRRRRME